MSSLHWHLPSLPTLPSPPAPPAPTHTELMSSSWQVWLTRQGDKPPDFLSLSPRHPWWLLRQWPSSWTNPEDPDIFHSIKMTKMMILGLEYTAKLFLLYIYVTSVTRLVVNLYLYNTFLQNIISFTLPSSQIQNPHWQIVCIGQPSEQRFL